MHEDTRISFSALVALAKAYERHAEHVQWRSRHRTDTARELVERAAPLWDVVDFGDHPELARTVSALRGLIASAPTDRVREHIESALDEAIVALADAMVRHGETPAPAGSTPAEDDATACEVPL